MTHKAWFQISIATLLVILIIKFSIEIKFIFTPFVIIFKAILLPVILGGALFYLVEPIQSKVEAKNVPRWASILIIVSAILILVAIIVTIIAPKLNAQFANLIDNFPVIVDKLNEWRLLLIDKVNHWPGEVGSTIESMLGTLESSAGQIGSGLLAFVQSVTSAIISLVLVPFFFIFMLKDHEKFAPSIYGLFSGNLRIWIKQTLYDINNVLRSYIQGQMVISVILATLLFIGYFLVGLEYALLLSVFALFMNVIPFLGPWIAFIPAATIALIQDPMMIIWVSLITLAAQQIDNHLITPNVMGKTLDIHPLTIITLLLVAGTIAGFFGILLAIPTYAMLKVIVRNIYLKAELLKEAITHEVD